MDGAAARADLLLPPHSPIRSQPGAWASPNPSWVAGPLALAGKECADPRAVPRAALDVERGRKTIHGLPTNVPPLPSPLPRPYSACIFFRTSPRLSKPRNVVSWQLPRESAGAKVPAVLEADRVRVCHHRGLVVITAALTTFVGRIVTRIVNQIVTRNTRTRTCAAQRVLVWGEPGRTGGAVEELL